MNILKELDTKIVEMIRTRAAFGKHSNKKDLVEYITMLRTEHMSIIRTIGHAMPTLGPKIARALKKDSKAFPCYFEYKKFLSNPASTQESKAALSTLMAANETMVGILDSMTKNIDKLFTTDKISILNMRISHVVVAGVLKQSIVMAKYTKYMLGYVSSIICSLDKNPKYRVSYLFANADMTANAVSKILDNAGAVDFMATIDKIRAGGSDINLISREAKSQVSSVSNAIPMGRNSSGVVVAGIAGIPLFRELGEAINLMRNIIGTYLEQEEEWMRSHVSILNSNLSGMDESDSEYKKLKLIVGRYESMINALAKLRSRID